VRRLVWFGGLGVLSLILSCPLALYWLWDRRVAWRVGTEGVAVYRSGELKRSFAWEQIASQRVLPFGVIARLDQCITLPVANKKHNATEGAGSEIR
jgi:hypothetical protein